MTALCLLPFPKRSLMDELTHMHTADMRRERGRVKYESPFPHAQYSVAVAAYASNKIKKTRRNNQPQYHHRAETPLCVCLGRRNNHPVKKNRRKWNQPHKSIIGHKLRSISKAPSITYHPHHSTYHVHRPWSPSQAQARTTAADPKSQPWSKAQPRRGQSRARIPVNRRTPAFTHSLPVYLDVAYST